MGKREWALVCRTRRAFRETGTTVERESPNTVRNKKRRPRQCPKKCVRFSFVLPLRLGVPQAGGEFVVLIFICRFT